MNKKYSFKDGVKRALKNGAWVFLTAMGIESFTFKIPYCIVLGAFLISASFLFFPWLDKLLSLIKVKLNSKNKWFIIVISFFIAAWTIKLEEVSYYKCILPITLMLLLWIGMVFYKKVRLK